MYQNAVCTIKIAKMYQVMATIIRAMIYLGMSFYFSIKWMYKMHTFEMHTYAYIIQMKMYKVKLNSTGQFFITPSILLTYSSDSGQTPIKAMCWLSNHNRDIEYLPCPRLVWQSTYFFSRCFSVVELISNTDWHTVALHRIKRYYSKCRMPFVGIDPTDSRIWTKMCFK